MTGPVVLDFLSDPMGGLLTSARAFLNRVRRFDGKTQLLVLEFDGAVSSGVDERDAFDWVDIRRPGGLRGLRRLAWQNLVLPGILRRHGAKVYVSLSHYLPVTLPAGVGSIVGISNLAPFSTDALAAEVSLVKRLRLRVLRWTIVDAAQRADRVIALSEAGRVELLGRGVSAEKIRKIPNGVVAPPQADVQQDKVALSRLGVTGDFILCVSHFYRYKNFLRLVEAYSRLPASLRARHPLLLVGAAYDPAYVEEVRQLADRLQLGAQVRIIPGVYDGDLSALYRRCRLFAFPSLIENSPITLLEALAHGAVVAAADIPAMREFGGDSAVYFDPRSSSAMAATMANALCDEALRATLAAKAPLQAAAHTWENFTSRLVATYRELLV